MADLTDDLVTLLQGSAGITAIVGSGTAARIYPLLVPESEPGEDIYPAISYQVISESRQPTLSKQNGLMQARVQINCWGRTYAGASALKEAVRNAIDGENTVFPAGCFIEDGQDTVEPSPDARPGRLYAKRIDAMIWVYETDPTFA